MSMDRTFAQLVADQVADQRSRSPLVDRISALRSIGRRWLPLSESLAAAVNPATIALLVALAAECQRAAEDLGLCPREAAP